jgi:hypothetical protein
MTEDVGAGALPGPLSHFVSQLDELRAGGVPDMDATGRLLAQLAGSPPSGERRLTSIGMWSVRTAAGPS